MDTNCENFIDIATNAGADAVKFQTLILKI